MLKGSLVAIVSPMFENGSLDLDALRRLIDWHIAEGTDGIVVVGTTGAYETPGKTEGAFGLASYPNPFRGTPGLWQSVPLFAPASVKSAG